MILFLIPSPSPHSSTGGVELEDLDVDDNKAYAMVKSGPTRAQRHKPAQQDGSVSLFHYVVLFKTPGKAELI